MVRKRKLQTEKHPGIPRGAEHIEAAEPGQKTKTLRLTPEGAEIPDPLPVTLPIKNKPFTTEQMRAQLSAIQAAEGPLEFETFEDANDFDIEDDFGDFVSKWEVPPDQQRAIDEYLDYRRTGVLPDHIVEATKRAAAKLNPPKAPTGNPVGAAPAAADPSAVQAEKS